MVPAAEPQPAPLLRAVQIMDRLRAPGGCPWDAEQTHESLTRYLVEECYEVVEAIETGDPTLLREELGDLLLQVLFHARIAAESAGGFDINDVAHDLGDKLIRRHPHVFACEAQPPGSPGALDADSLNETWEQQKIAEKGRTSAVDGVPIHQPALALMAKLVSRAHRARLEVDIPVVLAVAAAGTEDDIGDRLLAVVRDAVAAGIDPETALRRRARDFRAAIVRAERDASSPSVGRR